MADRAYFGPVWAFWSYFELYQALTLPTFKFSCYSWKLRVRQIVQTSVAQNYFWKMVCLTCFWTPIFPKIWVWVQKNLVWGSVFPRGTCIPKMSKIGEKKFFDDRFSLWFQPECPKDLKKKFLRKSEFHDHFYFQDLKII